MNWTTILILMIIIIAGIGYLIFTKKTHDKSKELTKEVLQESAVVYTRASRLMINGVIPERVGKVFFTRMLDLVQLYEFTGHANITADFSWTSRQGNTRVNYTITEAGLTTRLEKGKEYVLFIGNVKKIPEGADAAIGELKDSGLLGSLLPSNRALICLEMTDFVKMKFWQFER